MELIIHNPTADGFVKEISWNHDEIKAEVAERVAFYKTLVYTEEQLKDAKADRAKLNKFLEALETKRKEIKKLCLTPYEDFERQLKEITTLVKEPIELIDVQLKEYENKQKELKREEIIEYFKNVNQFDWLRFEQIFDNRWLNATASLNKVKSEIDDKLTKIQNELVVLAQLTEYGFEATEVYKSSLDMLKATNEAQRMSQIAKAKAEAEQRKRAEEFERNTNMVAPVVDEQLDGQVSFTDAQSFDKIVEDAHPRCWISFSANLTVKDAQLLKVFFESRNIEYKSI